MPGEQRTSSRLLPTIDSLCSTTIEEIKQSSPEKIQRLFNFILGTLLASVCDGGFVKLWRLDEGGVKHDFDDVHEFDQERWMNVKQLKCALTYKIYFYIR